MELPKRKKIRLTQYDYSTPNAYFITICTEGRRNLFWRNVGVIIDRPYNFYGSPVDEGSSIQTGRIPCLAKRVLQSCDSQRKGLSGNLELHSGQSRKMDRG